MLMLYNNNTIHVSFVQSLRENGGEREKAKKIKHHYFNKYLCLLNIDLMQEKYREIFKVIIQVVNIQQVRNTGLA